MIDKSNGRDNSKRLNIEYKAGDLVLLNKPGILPKLALPRAPDPFLIERYMMMEMSPYLKVWLSPIE